MKVVILAGGKGTRISEESVTKPKPLVTIGEKPIIWHIMNWYSKYGFSEFIICCGYKGHMLKEYFLNYSLYNQNLSFSMKNNQKNSLFGAESWKVTLVNTGLEMKTAGRLLKIREYLNDEPFMLTYGDGVGNIDIGNLLQFHKQRNKMVTISMTQPEGRFGALKLDMDNYQVLGFKEKARSDQAWVNIGFMVMEQGIFEYLGNGNSMLEEEPFEKLVEDKQLSAFPHMGFWSPMDNINDRNYLEKLWSLGQAPWK